jgi:hypothetical protein
LGRHPLIEIVKEAAERRPDHPLQLRLCWEFDPECAQASLGTFTQLFLRRRLWGAVLAEPRLHGVLVLAGWKTAAGVLPNQCQVKRAGTGMARIVRRVVPEQLELVGDERADGLWHLPEIVGEITQVLHGLEQDGDTVAIHIAAAGVHQGVFGWT